MSTFQAPLLEREGSREIEERLRPFREQGVLGSVEVHVVDHLGALTGEADPEVLLALALAVRAPGRGHICIDLLELDRFVVRSDGGEDEPTAREQLHWPEDTSDWLARIAASPLVRTPDAAPTEQSAFVLDGSIIYTERYFEYQERLAAALRERVEVRLEPRDDELSKRGLEVLFSASAGEGALDRQRLGAAMALLRGFTVISGGPGTGKTYTVRTVLTLLWSQWALDHDPDGETPGPSVALAAPTGKAAARMQEALLGKLDEFLQNAAPVLPKGRTTEQLRTFLTALQPTTIHRLLRYNPARPTRFRHDGDNPVAYEVVVVDEASMIAFALMAKLVDAVAPHARLILLGDKYQLASVEAGTVLADLCGPTRASRLTLSESFSAELLDATGVDVLGKTGVSVSPATGPHDAIVQLDRNRRFEASSGIGRFAEACLTDDFDAEAAVDILVREPGFEDVRVLPPAARGELDKRVAALLVAGYRPMIERVLAGPLEGESHADHHAAVLEAFRKFRVLCAHRRGAGGVERINRAVVALLERESARLAAQAGATGQPNPLAGFDSSGEFWPGRPIIVLQNDYVVQLFNGDTGIVVRDEGGRLTVAFPAAGGVTYLAPSRLPVHETVFAMTIHKSQGSEFDHAMVVLPAHDSPILTRELVYTAVTRARKRMTLVGDRGLLVSALRRTVRRASGLEAALWRGATGSSA